MRANLYADPLPYGSWALSFAVLMQVFLWLRPEDSDADNTGPPGAGADRWARDQEDSDDDGEKAHEDSWSGDRKGSYDDGGHSSSSAYKTDEEVSFGL